MLPPCADAVHVDPVCVVVPQRGHRVSGGAGRERCQDLTRGGAWPEIVEAIAMVRNGQRDDAAFLAQAFGRSEEPEHIGDMLDNMARDDGIEPTTEIWRDGFI